MSIKQLDNLTKLGDSDLFNLRGQMLSILSGDDDEYARSAAIAQLEIVAEALNQRGTAWDLEAQLKKQCYTRIFAQMRSKRPDEVDVFYFGVDRWVEKISSGDWTRFRKAKIIEISDYLFEGDIYHYLYVENVVRCDLKKESYANYVIYDMPRLQFDECEGIISSYYCIGESDKPR